MLDGCALCLAPRVIKCTELLLAFSVLVASLPAAGAGQGSRSHQRQGGVAKDFNSWLGSKETSSPHPVCITSVLLGLRPTKRGVCKRGVAKNLPRSPAPRQPPPWRCWGLQWTGIQLGPSGPQSGTNPEPIRYQSQPRTSPAPPGWFRVGSGLVPDQYRLGSGLVRVPTRRARRKGPSTANRNIAMPPPPWRLPRLCWHGRPPCRLSAIPKPAMKRQPY